jgi:glycoprotein endo-alpha-1,2-mannosidase
MGRGRLSTMIMGGLCAFALVFPAAGGSGRTSAGEAAIFYYPWYSTPTRDGHWAHWYVEDPDGASVLSTAYYPTRGLYSSSNVKLVRAQMKEIAAAGIRTVVVSWWGFGSPEDERLPVVLAAARDFRLEVAIHLEPYRERTPASAAEDVAKLHEQGIGDFYVYDADRDPAEAWAEALADLDGVRVFAHTHLVGRAKAGGFDGLYTYDVVTRNGNTFARLCSQARRAGLLCAPSVGPGYDASLTTQDPLSRPRLYGGTYDRMWRAAVRAKADVVTITSYNEWQEGTQIEPARVQIERESYEGAWGKRGVPAQRAYLDATLEWVLRYRATLAE